MKTPNDHIQIKCEVCQQVKPIVNMLHAPAIGKVVPTCLACKNTMEEMQSLAGVEAYKDLRYPVTILPVSTTSGYTPPTGVDCLTILSGPPQLRSLTHVLQVNWGDLADIVTAYNVDTPTPVLGYPTGIGVLEETDQILMENTLVDDEQIQFIAGTGILPTGLLADTTYFVKNASATKFSIVATAGGTELIPISEEQTLGWGVVYTAEIVERTHYLALNTDAEVVFTPSVTTVLVLKDANDLVTTVLFKVPNTDATAYTVKLQNPFVEVALPEQIGG